MPNKVVKVVNDGRSGKLEKLRLLERRNALVSGLPHLYRWKYYDWMREYLEHTNRLSFLVASNQCGKSTIQWIKFIDWATNKKKWPLLWRREPRTFWYLYPTKDVATIEWNQKIRPDLMPAGIYKDDPVYGWREEWRNRYLWAVHFNSGVSIYLKTYSQDVQDLQSGSVWLIAADEELPYNLYPELGMRISATDGYFSMVFTATLGQDEWRRTMEVTGEDELFKGAWKKCVSLYDCRFYEDGSESHWGEEQINRAINRCQGDAEVQRRIFGRFAIDSGRRYIGFEIKRNVVKPSGPIPADWVIYSGVDIGSGGKNHPAAITFIAVRPDLKFARIFKGWRGGKRETTAGDILNKYKELKGNMVVTGQWYDYSSRDFFQIATQSGEPFQPADKHQDIGVQLVNVLFKNSMLMIDDIDELRPLVGELCTLQHSVNKTIAKDDAIDSLRYSCVKVPWDLSCITGDRIIKQDPAIITEAQLRRMHVVPENFVEFDLDASDEIAAWNELYES